MTRVAIHALALLIATKEGFYAPRSLPQRLHNPGALVFVHQAGAIRGDRGYARFTTDQAGWEALERDIAKKVAQGRPLKRAWAYLP